MTIDTSATIITDLSTETLIDLLDSDQEWIEEGFEELLKFVSIFYLQESSEEELIRRSLTNRKSAATNWLAENFDKTNRRHVHWLEEFQIQWPDDWRFELNDSAELWQQTRVIRFVEEEVVTGLPEQWGYINLIPEDRRSVCIDNGVAYLPVEGGLKIDGIKPVPSGNGFYKREVDGKAHLFLRRGSREVGDKGWLWVVLLEEHGKIIQGIDPLGNYEALEWGYRPVRDRIDKAFQSIQ